MSWTVILEDENRGEVISLGKEFSLKSFETIVKNRDIKLIKYLDPYGDTIFNCAQMKDLISDLEYIMQTEPANQVIDEIILFAQKCLNHPHHYLVFYGD
ncbi:MAG: hypothetical protein SFV55_29280 [Haliscomenobacter sp.]|uniref:hypothetical protein n=1 Tax=Haliscomenobacter sp. TaxID=2717303 RepID=UPI0029AE1F87|nr:hypothetical protein [Haliscomenobacter sp.]MDX2072563.1 hypothetical protein [Haliscomenobacter sp.]